MLAKIEAEEEGTTEDEMIGWHHRLKAHEFEQALGVGDGQGSLACCSPWHHGAFLIAQMVENLPAMQDSQVRS